MNANLEHELPLRQYLLGDLNSDEQQRVEQHLMIGTAVFEELSWIEDELIDDYLEGTLSGHEKQKFESFFLTAPERRRKLDFAKALKRYVAAHRPGQNSLSVWRSSWQAFWRPQSPVLSRILAASLVLLIAGGSWSILRISGLQKELEQARSWESQKKAIEIQNRNSELTSALQREQARLAQLEQEATNLKNSEKRGTSSLLNGQMQSTLISVTLTPGLLRDLGGSQKIRIPAGTDQVQFDLKIEPQDFHEYRAALQRLGESEFWTQISPKTESGAQDQAFRLTVPANIMKSGDYILRLSGMTSAGDFEEIDKYYFRVVSK